jgi:hypothetical protein
MANDDRTKIIPRRTPESATMLANVKRAMAIIANQPFDVQRCGRSPGLVQQSHRQEGGRQLFIDPTILHNRWGRHQYRAQCFRKSELHFFMILAGSTLPTM